MQCSGPSVKGWAECGLLGFARRKICAGAGPYSIWKSHLVQWVCIEDFQFVVSKVNLSRRAEEGSVVLCFVFKNWMPQYEILNALQFFKS